MATPHTELMAYMLFDAELANREPVAKCHQFALQLLDQLGHSPVRAACCVWAGCPHRRCQAKAHRSLKRIK